MAGDRPGDKADSCFLSAADWLEENVSFKHNMLKQKQKGAAVNEVILCCCQVKMSYLPNVIFGGKISDQCERSENNSVWQYRQTHFNPVEMELLTLF